MKLSSRLCAALMGLALSAAAQSQPGSAAPKSGNCGQSARMSEEDLKNWIRSEAYLAAGTGAAALAKLAPPPELVFVPERNTKMAWLDADGGKPSIKYNRALCDVAASPAEVTFILTHELMHVKLDHVAKLKAEQARLKEKECRGSESCVEERSNAFMSAREDEADGCAEAALSRSGAYSQAQAAAARKKFMQHLQDLYWAINSTAKDPNHRPPQERAASDAACPIAL